MKSAAISIIISSIIIIPLFTRNLKAEFYSSDEDCFSGLNPFYSLKMISITILLLMNLYRIYFSLGWVSVLITPGDSSYKAMLKEVMWLQRAYRTVVYGIILLLSTILFIFSCLLEYYQLKSCLNGKNEALDIVIKEYKFSLICIGVIILFYMYELITIRFLVKKVLKKWNTLDYRMGERTKLGWIFFFKSLSIIQIIPLAIFISIIFLNYKFSFTNKLTKNI